MKDSSPLKPQNDTQPLTLSEQIFNVMKEEYQQEVNANKAKDKTKEKAKDKEKDKDKQPQSIESYNLGFADITIWFYKRNSQQSLEEARYIWDLLPQNPLQRHNLMDYLNVYTQQIFDKHQKYCYYHKKYRKVESIINRTQALIEALRESFNKISGQNQQSEPFTRESMTIPDSLRFSIYLSGLDGLPRDPPNKSEDFVGYHVELGYQNNVVSSSIQAPVDNQVNFKNRKLDFAFSIKEGSIFINLYEDYMEEGEVKKVLIARRNLDLYTNINEKSLNNILSFIGDDIELSADFDELRFETYQLKKTQQNDMGGDEEGGKDSDDFIKLNMAIVVEKFRKLEDLQLYYKILQKRKEFLEAEMKNIKLKSSGYKTKLALMLLPFSETITFDERSISVAKKLNKSQQKKHKGCNIF